MPVEDVVVAVRMAKNRARRDAGYFQEQLGSAWMTLAIPHYIDEVLVEVKELRDQLNKGQITQAQFDSLQMYEP
jgi:hypothetical protein